MTIVSRDCDGLPRDRDRDERAGLFERIGENGEKRLRLLARDRLEDGERLRFCTGLLRWLVSLRGACSKIMFSPGVHCPRHFCGPWPDARCAWHAIHRNP